MSEATGTTPVILVTNRAPVVFTHDGTRLRFDRGSGGVVTALTHVRGTGAVTWVAATAGDDDRAVAARQREHGGIIGSGQFALRLVHLAPDLYRDYCDEFSNRILWFAQHGLWGRRIEPESSDRLRALHARYMEAADAFAAVVATEAHRPGRAPIVLSQDFQLYGFPRALRRKLPGLRISHFVHIPWPSLAVWRAALPDDILADLLRALLGADVIGFQDSSSRRNFAEAVRALLGGLPASEDEVTPGDGRTVRLRVRPAAIDASELRVNQPRAQALDSTDKRLIVRIDRVDPIKNVPMGFAAFALMLEAHPEWVGRVRFLARLVPSRSALPEYARESRDTAAAIDAVNERFGRDTVECIERQDRGKALAEMAAADVILVNSIADGMNLVAKESTMLSDDAVLVLSRHAGAWEELATGALGIDPTSVEETAEALYRALTMDANERRARNGRMRAALNAWTSRDWTQALLGDLTAEGVPSS